MSEKVAQLVNYPLPWASMSLEQQFLFSNSTCSTAETFPTNPSSQDICECLYLGRWVRTLPFPWQFNNVFSGLFTFWEISSTSGWEDVMWAAVDQRGIGAQPIRNANTAWVAFFVVFILVGYIFLYNVFIGAVVDFFTKASLMQGPMFTTLAQQDWIRMQVVIKRMRARRKFTRPRNEFRLVFFTIALSPLFEGLNSTLIILNALVLAMQFYGEPMQYSSAIQNINTSVSVYFNFELFIKVCAFGVSFFNDGWNVFDCMILVGIDVTLIFGQVSGNYMSSLTSVGRVGRILRLVRIFRLTSALRGVNKLLDSLTSSLPAFLNVALLILLVMLIYAIAGIQLFAKVASYQNTITANMNFRNLGFAIILLFRMATQDNWNYYAHSMSGKSPGCVVDPPYNPNWCELNGFADNCVPLNGCGSFAAFPYFYSFQLVVSISLMNLFIGVIIDSIKGHNKDMNISAITEEVINDYNYVWDLVDPYRTNMFPRAALPKFVGLVKEPLGLSLRHREISEECENFADRLNIPHVTIDGKEFVKYKAVTVTLIKEMLSTVHQDFPFETYTENKGLASEMKRRLSKGTKSIKSLLSNPKKMR